MIKVMSFNIRYATAPDGENSWPHRRGLVIGRVRALRLLAHVKLIERR
jgi:hypothetical protein